MRKAAAKDEPQQSVARKLVLYWNRLLTLHFEFMILNKYFFLYVNNLLSFIFGFTNFYIIFRWFLGINLPSWGEKQYGPLPQHIIEINALDVVARLYLVVTETNWNNPFPQWTPQSYNLLRRFETFQHVYQVLLWACYSIPHLHALNSLIRIYLKAHYLSWTSSGCL